MKPLMARTKNIESLFKPPFGKLETCLATLQQTGEIEA
jgi:hypothetical protein